MAMDGWCYKFGLGQPKRFDCITSDDPDRGGARSEGKWRAGFHLLFMVVVVGVATNSKANSANVEVCFVSLCLVAFLDTNSTPSPLS